MMMDDIYFSDPVECPDCHKRYEWGSMIWLNGHCTCPECYEHRKRELDRQRGKEGRMTNYIKIDNSYINTAFITSVLEVTRQFRCNNEWKTDTLVEIHTVDGGTFYFNGTLDDAITLIKGA